MFRKIFSTLLLLIGFYGPQNVFGDPPQLHMCTVGTELNKGLSQLLDSCNYRNIKIEVLGFAKPFRGLAQKLIFVQDYIQTLPDDDVVMFVDGYDVLILNDIDTILQAFLDVGHSFIISGERFCWPLTNRCHEFPSNNSSFRFVNSGVYIGYVGTIKAVFKSFSPINPRDDDQGLLSAYYLSHSGEIQIDAACQFFLTTAGVLFQELELDYLNRQIQIKATGVRPFALHGNGGSRPIYQTVYEALFNGTTTQ